MARALISVSDKSGVIEFALELVRLGFEIISTGGTLKVLEENGIRAIDVSSITNFPELFEGRVKTLHPKIHGAILYRRGIDEEVAKANQIEAIDLVVVNLYPFKEATQKSDDFDFIVENIDIGGPALIRAGAKNYKSVLVVTNQNRYQEVLEAIKNGTNDIEFRKKYMVEAFAHTANYDSYISNFLSAPFGDSFFISGTKVFDTRYGENPHQKGALYQFDDTLSKNLSILQGEPSFNNLLDINSVLKIVSTFQNSVCIVKHNNPCGFAMGENLFQSFTSALVCDPLSAFGGVVAVSGTIDALLALEMSKTFFEAIIAKEITQEALEIFKNKKRLKVFKYRDFEKSKLDFRAIEGGFLLQEADLVSMEELCSIRQVSVATAHSEIDLKIAYKLASFTKSNCITVVKDGVLLAIGMGMTSRVDATKCAFIKAKEQNIDLNGASLASEAFFPFRDSIDLAHSVGIKSIIEPGGSIRDNEVIEAANEFGIALYFSDVRHFLH